MSDHDQSETSERAIYLTDEEIGALLASTAEARSLVEMLSKDKREDYVTTPWWSANEKLLDALGQAPLREQREAR